MSKTGSGFLGKLRRAAQPAAEQPGQTRKTITVVSGLPRSGTSMMMKMLEAAGIPPLTDEIREADADNPKGYYEFERVKQLNKGDIEWLDGAQGKSVKVIAALLRHLPPTHDYRVIFMRRSLDETLKSQKQMLIRRGEPTNKVSDEEMAVLYRKHLHQIERWVAQQPHVKVLYVDYNEVMRDPLAQAQQVNQFLGGNLDVENMAGVVDSTLYRQRRS
jgi:hypothetical protein